MSDDSLNKLIALMSQLEESKEETLASVPSKSKSTLKKEILKMIRKSSHSSLSSEELQNILKIRFKELSQMCQFSPGDFVKWKPGLKNKLKPEYDEPVIVVEQLKSPVYDSDQSGGSPYFREPLDIIIALIDEDNDFALLHFDSRRFKPF